MKSLEELRAQIEETAPTVGRGPYSHNIIALYLQQIAHKYGNMEANRAIEDFGLEELGWQKHEGIPQ